MSTSTTRRRSISFGKARNRGLDINRRRLFPFTEEQEQLNSTQGGRLVGDQVTVSENHRWPPPKGRFSGDVGGNFFTEKRYAVIHYGGPVTTRRTSTTGTYGYQSTTIDNVWCPVKTVNGKTDWPTSLRSSDEELEDQGATAVANCSPTNASSDLLVSLGELFKEGLPSLLGHQMWKPRAQIAQGAGSEYLNAEFGWKPLISDITKFGNTVRNAERIMQQYERDMGNLVRRGWDLPSERSETTELLNPSQPPSGLFKVQLSSSPSGTVMDPIANGVWSRKIERSSRTWFSGAFSYGVPLGSTGREGMSSLAQEADKLFGISLTPDVLWNLAPWSWAVDWFTNTGDVLANLSDVVTQGLVMHYGYVMEHSIHKHTYSLEGCKVGTSPLPIPKVQLVTETKVRRKANPFGFGVSWSGLSPFQLSIAAALGISRA